MVLSLTPLPEKLNFAVIDTKNVWHRKNFNPQDRGFSCVMQHDIRGCLVTQDKGFKEQKMLILTRRVGETLVIGDDVNVTVLGVRGNQVRLGVNAPKEVAVHREEIYQRIQKENDSDNSSSDDD